MLLQKKSGSSASSATFGCRQHIYQAKHIEADEESRTENQDTNGC